MHRKVKETVWDTTFLLLPVSLKTKLISDITNINQNVQKQNILLIQHKQTLQNKVL